MYAPSLLLVSSLILSGVQFASALSSACENGFIQVASNSQGTCLNILGLVNILQATTVNGTLLPWLQSACSQPVCTNADLNFTATTIGNACAFDLSSPSFQINAASIQQLADTVMASYGLVHDTVCLMNTTSGQYVVNEMALALINFNSTSNGYTTNGTLLSPFDWASYTAQLPLCATFGLPTNITCSEDVLALYAVLLRQDNSLATSPEIIGNCATQCGSSFLSSMSAASTGLPSGYTIQNTAPVYTPTPSVSASPSSTSNNAKSVIPDSTLVGVAISALAVIASAFVLLA